MRQECNLLAQQNGILQLQLQQAHDRQVQMREHYMKEVQKLIDSVVANAAAREAERVSSVQDRGADPALLRQLEQVLHELVGAIQEAENGKVNSAHWEEQTEQLESLVEELARKPATPGVCSGADTHTFSERCASQQRYVSASYGLQRMFASASPAPKLPGAHTARGQRRDDDELVNSL